MYFSTCSTGKSSRSQENWVQGPDATLVQEPGGAFTPLGPIPIGQGEVPSTAPGGVFQLKSRGKTDGNATFCPGRQHSNGPRAGGSMHILWKTYRKRSSQKPKDLNWSFPTCCHSAEGSAGVPRWGPPWDCSPWRGEVRKAELWKYTTITPKT